MRTNEMWRPIETAPKDGTAVLLYCPDLLRWGDAGRIGLPPAVVGVWAEVQGEAGWYSDIGEARAEYDCGVVDLNALHPTHWVPLPEFPAG